MVIPRKKGWAIIAALLLFFGFTLWHASWLAPAPEGAPRLIANGGVALPTGTDGCILDAEAGYGTAITPPELRMLQGAMGAGANAINLTYEAKGGQLYAPRLFNAECAADARRPPAMLAQAPALLSAATLFVPVKSSADIPALLAAIPASANAVFYGDAAAISALRKARPGASAFDIAAARTCTISYRNGVLGQIPASCKGGWALLTLDDLGITLWGWPNRFLARMRGANMQVIIAQNIADGQISGLTSLDQYSEIASSYNGYIWIDNIADLGPALKR